jgi:hypothetical protein
LLAIKVPLHSDRFGLLTGSFILHEFPERRFCGHRVGVFAVFTAFLHFFKDSVDSSATSRSLIDPELMRQLVEVLSIHDFRASTRLDENKGKKRCIKFRCLLGGTRKIRQPFQVCTFGHWRACRRRVKICVTLQGRPHANNSSDLQSVQRRG